MKFAEFYPSEPANSDDLLVMGPILGGCLETADGTPGDHAYRAGVIAEQLGVNVLAYSGIDETVINSRPTTILLGLPKAYEPSEYALANAADARQLQAEVERRGVHKVHALGVSLEGGHLLGMLATELFETEETTLFDPTEARDRTKMSDLQIPQGISQLIGLGGWIAHQGNARLLHREATRNQHPMDHMGKSPVNHFAQLVLLRKILTRDAGLETIKKIATGTLCVGARTRLIVPEHTFTGSLDYHLKVTDELNTLATANEVDFRARVNAKQWHATSDDPYECVKLL